MVQVRVWKYLDDTGIQKQLIDMVESENIDFIKEIVSLYNDIYDNWNFQIEIKGVK